MCVCAMWSMRLRYLIVSCMSVQFHDDIYTLMYVMYVFAGSMIGADIDTFGWYTIAYHPHNRDSHV